MGKLEGTMATAPENALLLILLAVVPITALLIWLLLNLILAVMSYFEIERERNESEDWKDGHVQLLDRQLLRPSWPPCVSGRRVSACP